MLLTIDLHIPQGPLEGKNVADTPYGNETWMTEFVVSRKEGKENAWKVYAVLHTH